MAEKKKESKESKVVEMPDSGIQIESRIIAALPAAIDGGDWVAAQNICNEILEIAEDQKPHVFRSHRHP